MWLWVWIECLLLPSLLLLLWPWPYGIHPTVDSETRPALKIYGNNAPATHRQCQSCFFRLFYCVCHSKLKTAIFVGSKLDTNLLHHKSLSDCDSGRYHAVNFHWKLHWRLARDVFRSLKSHMEKVFFTRHTIIPWLFIQGMHTYWSVLTSLAIIAFLGSFWMMPRNA